MLLEFSVTNFRSIAEKQIISFLPEKKLKDSLENILTEGKHEALNAIALYGANASGKSNILKAMEIFDKIIYISARANSTTKLPYQPFLLKEGFEILPTSFEMKFVLNEKRYTYSFSYNREKIVSEYLYRKGDGREVRLFGRQDDTIEASTGFHGSPLLIDAAIEATRDNSLFLSFCDMFNVEEANKLFGWFNNVLNVNGINTEREEVRTVNIWENEIAYRQKIKDYLKLLELDFIDLEISVKDFDISDLPTELDDNVKNQLAKELEGKRGFKPTTTHTLYNKEGEKTEKTIFWKLDDHESEGTQKAFHLSGPILKTLLEGGVLIIDEIEAKMHSIMIINIIKLFLNPETNPNKAQILFATHDTNLLSYTNLRRDQINFVEKNKWEASEVYALSDVKHKNEQSERADTDKEKRYLEGRYGAIPALGIFTKKIVELYGKKG